MISSFTSANSSVRDKGSPGPFDKNTPPISLLLKREIKSAALNVEGTTSTSKPVSTSSFKIFLLTPKSTTTIFLSLITALL